DDKGTKRGQAKAGTSSVRESTAIQLASLAGALLLALSLSAQTASLSDRVLVVYSAHASGSRGVAKYYMAKRGIPAANICKIGTSSTETIDAGEFESHVKGPIRKCLEKLGRDKILYIVFSYGSPFDLQLNGQTYALDQFIADIWDEYLPFRPARQTDVQPYFGYAQSEGNIYQKFISLSAYRKKPGAPHIYSVWRLDAATPALAKGLADKALYAEAHGLSGRGCFDLNAPADSQADYSYGAGNWDIYRAAEFARRAGFSILADTHHAEFGSAPAPLRCDGAALYAGWYSLNHYNDAFTWNPGAIGIHLDSASAVNPRSGLNWAANALKKGITITSGAVTEPYLENLPHPDQAFLYFFEGANAGDALLRSTRLLKWRIINIGDPLYRPFPHGAHPSGAKTPEIALALLPQSTVSGATTTAVIGIDRPAPEGGLKFSVKSNRPAWVEVPLSVTIPAGANHATFPIRARTVKDDATTLLIYVSRDQLQGSNTLVLFPVLGPLVLRPGTVRGGSSGSGLVVLRRKAPADGIAVALASSDAEIVKVPAEIKVAAGQNTARFPVATQHVIAQHPAVITASFAGTTRKATLTVVP
ncbi:MAG: TIGR03790 family protein, partial [Bryobacteraceae bacterium]